MFKKIRACLTRNIQVNASYRLSFCMDIISVAASTTTFFFISKFFNQHTSAPFSALGSDYFSFVLIGIAFNGYLSAGLSSFHQAISYEQSEGTLELLLLSPTKLPLILTCAVAGNFLFVTARTLAYFFIGWLIFGLDITHINFISSICIVLLATISFVSLGILSASFLLVFKRGDPIDWIFGGLSRLLGGVFFPISVLPAFLQHLSLLLPTTYILQALRKSIIHGVSIPQLMPEISYLVLFAAFCAPLSFFAFNAALHHAKKNGSLLYS